MVSIYQVKEVLGEVAASTLCEQFPGQQIYIPKKQTSLQFESIDDRNKYICNLFHSAGMSYDEIAAQMDLTKDRIMKIVSGRYINK